MMSPAVGVVAWREYRAVLGTRSFWLGIAAVPLLLAVTMVFYAFVFATETPVRFAVVDRSGWLDDAITATQLRGAAAENGQGALAPEALDGPRRAAALNAADRHLLRTRRFERVRTAGLDRTGAERALAAGALFAVVLIPEDPLAPDARVRVLTERRTRPEFEDWLGNAVNAALRERRARQAGLSPDQARSLLRYAPLDVRTPGAPEGEANPAEPLAELAPLAYVYALVLAILAMTHRLLTSTVDERTSRLLDVMLSIVDPEDLLAGKLLGLAAVGVTLFAAWFAWPVLLLLLAPGHPAVALLRDTVAPGTVALFLTYFLLAYALYGTWLAALGALCRDVRDANNLLAPAQVLLITPLALMLPVVRDPEGWLAQVLSWVPPLTPFVMMNRIAAPPAAWEYAGSIALLLLCLALSWGPARALFRHGVLNSPGAGSALARLGVRLPFRSGGERAP